MSFTALESKLRALARERIQDGRLPNVQANRCWGGKGTGGACVLCDEPIGSDDIEFEIEIATDGAKRSYCLHALCHAAWKLECVRAEFLRSAAQAKAESSTP